jgi:hypothetical protein
MTNVIQFPSGPSNLAPMPALDALIGELTTVEIKLARARLAQIQSETRQANVLWFWYCLKRALCWGGVLWLLIVLMKPAAAQNQTTFRDSRGSTIGTATRTGNTVTFRNTRGSTTGTARRRRSASCKQARRPP